MSRRIIPPDKEAVLLALIALREGEISEERCCELTRLKRTEIRDEMMKRVGMYSPLREANDRADALAAMVFQLIARLSTETDDNDQLLAKASRLAEGEPVPEEAECREPWEATHMSTATFIYDANGSAMSARDIVSAHNGLLVELNRARTDLKHAKVSSEEHLAEAYRLRVECAELVNALCHVSVAIDAYTDLYSLYHDEDGCPEDDTCECPIISSFNEAMGMVDRLRHKHGQLADMALDIAGQELEQKKRDRDGKIKD